MTPSQNKPAAKTLFAPLPVASNGSEQMDDVFRAVGAALTQWEFVETAFAELFGTLLGAPGGSAARAYGVVTTSGARRDMIMQAAHGEFPHDEALLAQIKDILSIAEVGSQRRNEIAHGAVMRLDDRGEDRGCYLIPPTYVSKKFRFIVDATFTEVNWNGVAMLKSMVNYAYTAEQIDRYAAGFNAFANMVRAVSGVAQTTREIAEREGRSADK